MVNAFIQRSWKKITMGLPWAGGIQCGPRRKKLQILHGVDPNNRSRADIRHSSVFQPRKYTYDLPAPPTQEEVVQKAEKALGDSLRTLATKNPTYTHLSNFLGLQKMSDIFTVILNDIWPDPLSSWNVWWGHLLSFLCLAV